MRLGNFSLRNLRQRDWAIIFIVLSILAGVLWYFYMYKPTQEQITVLEDDIARLDIEIRRGEDARRNLPDLRLAVAQLEEDRRVFLAELPRESDVAGLIDQLRIQDVRPIGFSVATQGTFGDTMTFLSRLEELQRFTKIQQVGLNLEDNTSTDPTINATYAFTVYVYTGADPGEQ